MKKLYCNNKNYRFYKYVDYDSAVKIISNNSLLFSNPSSFNDPFDCFIGLLDIEPNDKLIKRFQTYLHENESDINISDFKQDDSETFKRTIKEFLSISLDTIKISCFTTEYLNPLMWAHYTEKHKGICLGFDFAYNNPDFIIKKVNYNWPLEKIDFYKGLRNILIQWLTTKSRHWDYEKEYRIINFDLEGFISFDKTCLKEIYFGTKLVEDTIFEMINLLNINDYSNEIECYQIKINDLLELERVKMPSS